VERDLEGRVILLTGATEGLGRAAAAAFAARGATLTIVGRNRAKTEGVVESLRRSTGDPAVDHLIGDLSLLSGARAVAAGFRARHDRLDVLVNNAGAIFQRYRRTADGIENTFALNHLGYFVVTTELLNLLRGTPGARIVNTASSVHRFGRLDLDTVVERDGIDGIAAGFRAYFDSKLANVLFTRELARRLAGSGVTANCVHPGFVRSGLFGGTAGASTYVLRSRLAGLFARTPEQAAAALVWLATDPAAAPYSGEYFAGRKVARVGRRARDADLGAALWKLSEWLSA
jgi:NAD(P)-dependent dehydrogenase (short-subunit alcohol dehydrogenase family)